MESQPLPKSAVRHIEDSVKSDSFPHGRAMLDAFKTYLNRPKSETSKNVDDATTREAKNDKATEVITTFFQQEMDNLGTAHILHSDNPGNPNEIKRLVAEFPYTQIDITALGKTLYESTTGTKISPDKLKTPKFPDSPLVIAELPSAVNLLGGGPFSFTEATMAHVFRYLPRVFRALEAGEIPQQIDIYNLGTPTQELMGYVSPIFADRIGNNSPSEVYGAMYAQFLDQAIPDLDSRHLLIEGTSMGGGFGESTAAVFKDTHPELYVQVLEDLPAPFHDKGWRKAVQVAVGFLRDGIKIQRTNPYTAQTLHDEKQFAKYVASQMEERGMIHKRSDELKSRQRKVMSKVLKEVAYTGLTHDKAVADQVTVLQGTSDRTTLSEQSQREISELKQRREEAILRRIADDQDIYTDIESIKINPQDELFGPRNPDTPRGSDVPRRAYLRELPHNMPYYRDRVMMRLDNVVTKLQKLSPLKPTVQE